MNVKLSIAVVQVLQHMVNVSALDPADRQMLSDMLTEGMKDDASLTAQINITTAQTTATNSAAAAQVALDKANADKAAADAAVTAANQAATDALDAANKADQDAVALLATETSSSSSS